MSLYEHKRNAFARENVKNVLHVKIKIINGLIIRQTAFSMQINCKTTISLYINQHAFTGGYKIAAANIIEASLP